MVATRRGPATKRSLPEAEEVLEEFKKPKLEAVETAPVAEAQESANNAASSWPDVAQAEQLADAVKAAKEEPTEAVKVLTLPAAKEEDRPQGERHLDKSPELMSDDEWDKVEEAVAQPIMEVQVYQ